MRDGIDDLIEVSRWQREAARELGISIPSVMDRRPVRDEIYQRPLRACIVVLALALPVVWMLAAVLP